MKNLKESGIILKTIQPLEYAKVIEDINFNFLQMLNAPGFKGMPGESVKGDTGEGIRGTKWIFVSISDFEDKGAQNENDVTLEKINEWFIDNPQDFVNHITIPDDSELVYGDTLVLPNGQVVQLNLTNQGDRFEDTGITFAQVSSLTVEEVTNIVKKLLGPQQDSEVLKYYNALAKNASDQSPALNQNLTTDSIIDIDVVGGGPGTDIPNHKFYGPTDLKIGPEDSVMFVAGSVERYHRLIQGTQTLHNNDYGPGVDDWASLAVLQNSYKNGMILGHKNSDSLRSFSRIYKSTESLVLTSSYSPNPNEYSDLELFDDKIILRTLETIINSNKFTHIGEIFTTKHITQDLSELILGSTNNKVIINSANGLFLNDLKNIKLLGTDNDGKVISRIGLIDYLDNTSSAEQILNAQKLYEIVTNINSNISDLEDRVEVLESSDSSVYYKKLTTINIETETNQDLLDCNNYTTFGFTNFIMGAHRVLNSPFTTSGQTLTLVTYNGFSLDVKCVSGVNGQGNPIEYIDQKIVARPIVLGSGGVTRKTQPDIFYRSGYRVNDIYTWNNWTAVTTGTSRIRASGAITLNDLGVLEHQKKATGLDDIIHSANEYDLLRAIYFDAYGHVRAVMKTSTLDTGITMQPGLFAWHTHEGGSFMKGYVRPLGQYMRAIDYPLLYVRLKDYWGPYKYEDLPAGWANNINLSDLKIFEEIDPRLMFKIPNAQHLDFWAKYGDTDNNKLMAVYMKV